uniref:Uncharacterized protein n=1 Tax=Tanacetum cinerariifolium TaxID=118510 RepID=A0A699L9L4_TANCI|nr:hypothetical protein [Tanacetum cinerariifolium]
MIILTIGVTISTITTVTTSPPSTTTAPLPLPPSSQPPTTLSPPQPPLITHIPTSLPSPLWLHPRATIINTATIPSTQQGPFGTVTDQGAF